MEKEIKITIIGANSFIARNVIYEISQREKSNLKIQLNLYDCQEQHLDSEEHYEKINILSVNSVDKIKFDVDVIFVFTGKTGTLQGFDDYNTFIDINERALLNILTIYCKQKSKAKVVFPSTRLVYHGQRGLLKEDSIKEFKTIYAINKFACEEYLKMYHNVYGVKFAIFRICVPYGTMIPNASSYGTAEFMLNKAKKHEDISLYGDGSVRRTLIHMQDLCNILIEGALAPDCIDDIYNIGGENYSLKEMAEKIAKCYHVRVKHVEWPKQALKIESGDTVFDSEKLDELLKYQYINTFEEWVEKQEI